LETFDLWRPAGQAGFALALDRPGCLAWIAGLPKFPNFTSLTSFARGQACRAAQRRAGVCAQASRSAARAAAQSGRTGRV